MLVLTAGLVVVAMFGDLPARVAQTGVTLRSTDAMTGGVPPPPSWLAHVFHDVAVTRAAITETPAQPSLPPHDRETV